MHTQERKRCDWSSTDPLYIKYHDTEWGVPVHNDRKIFEFLTLEGMQAGLSWRTVLTKRENYRKAFDRFDPLKVALYEKRKVKELLGNGGIIRNKLKIESAINNAKAFLKASKEFGRFDSYIWQFVGNKTVRNRWTSLGQIPSTSKQSDAMSKDLKERGFKFVGSTICYAHMQATGMVNDHLVSCFRYKEVAKY